MNIFDIVILAILAVSIISGMVKGFLASGLAIAGFLVAWIGAMQLYPLLSHAVQSNTGLMSMLNYYLDPASLFPKASIGDMLVTNISKSQLGQLIAQMQLPEVIVNAFRDNVLSRAFSSLRLDTLAEYLGQTICGGAINVLSFLLMFIVSYVVMLLVVNLLNHVFRFPQLKHMDSLLGGLFGLVRGVVVALLVFAIVPLILSMIPMQAVQEVVDGSKLYGIFAANHILERLMQAAF